MLNARIKKTVNQKKIPIFSIGNPGDLTYKFDIVGDNTQFIDDFVNNKNEFNKKFLNSKKPIVIIGESALSLKSGKFIFEEIKNFLNKNNYITDEWNALNILNQNASSVGAIDLNILNTSEENNFIFFDKLENRNYKFLYLLGSDNLIIKKEKEFIVYQGSHGDRGAEIADIILPSPAYTEQKGLFTNVEGRTQECKKASYPTGEAKEDWIIFNLILKLLDKNEFGNFEKIRSDVLKLIPNFSGIDSLPKKMIKFSEKNKSQLINETVVVNKIDYYFTNSISRSSKTMADCRNTLSNQLKDGTNN